MSSKSKARGASVGATKQTPVEAIKTAVPSATPKPAAAPERITEFQELACDLFSSVLFEGAAPEFAPEKIGRAHV